MSAARPVREKLPLVTLTEFKKAKPARPSELAKVRKIARRLGDHDAVATSLPLHRECWDICGLK